MNLVSWNCAFQFKSSVPADDTPEARDRRLWCDTARPTCYDELVGNGRAILAIEEWYRKAAENPTKSFSLFVHGESGTGKSTAVAMAAKKFQFETVATYADRSRTPARLEGIVREAGVYGARGVVILDDFEIFLSETTSLRVLSKLLRKLVPGTSPQTDSTRSRSPQRCLFVIICNAEHRLFGPLQDISTVVRFERLSSQELHTIHKRLAARVRHHSYVPPMVLYLSSASGSGTITQGIQQLQLLYGGNEKTDFVCSRHRGKKRSLGGTVLCDRTRPANTSDCVSFLRSDIYTDRILHHMLDAKFHRGSVVDRLLGFEKGQLDIVGNQLHEEYARRAASVQQLRSVAESLSAADSNRIEPHADALFDGENRGLWSANDVSYVALVADGIIAIKGQWKRDRNWSQKPRARLPRYRDGASSLVI